ncbi:HupE/UreJ family protein [uncultured Abyssibacter sp.]|uniref:HupE/UreJ family protein n=1 Tax=uncultured Abyssibacter sp. TaxID=2320202 RepID=UPI0032B29F85
MIRTLLTVALLMTCGQALAHKPSDSYLSLELSGRSVTGQWDIALRDLELAIGLDADADRRITWGEVRQREDAITSHALSHLQVSMAGQTCTLDPVDLRIADHTDGRYAAITLRGDCPTYNPRLVLRYDLLFQRDAQHRGLLRLGWRGRVESAIFSPARRELAFDLGETRPLRVAWQYLLEGLWHVWIGLDHLLFLAGLLLPLVVRREAGGFVPAPDARTVVHEVLLVVTSFTLAHFAALSLATLGLVDLPSRWVESAVALTIVFAALNNLLPIVRRRLWLVAFGFGLIHGAGYASVLSDLGLSATSLALSLLAFNLGVEGAQIIVAALFLPAAFLLRHSRIYQYGVLIPGSLLVALIGMIWCLERMTNQSLMPW